VRNDETVSEAQTIPQKKNVPQFLKMTEGTNAFIDTGLKVIVEVKNVCIFI
jgi:hypothetical protein